MLALDVVREMPVPFGIDAQGALCTSGPAVMEGRQKWSVSLSFPPENCVLMYRGCFPEGMSEMAILSRFVKASVPTLKFRRHDGLPCGCVVWCVGQYAKFRCAQ